MDVFCMNCIVDKEKYEDELENLVFRSLLYCQILSMLEVMQVN